MSDTRRQPIFKKQLRRGIAAAVFENMHEDRIYRSIDLQRSYYRNSQWHRMNISLSHEDIPFIIAALEATWDFLNEPNTQLNPEHDADIPLDDLQ